MNYLAAYLQYADLIFTSTQSTLDQVNQLLCKLKLPTRKGCVTWLGSDFTSVPGKDRQISPKAKHIAKKGKYILCVGTIEPRKNHRLLLEAYDGGLADMGIDLVFAGRIGWNVEDIKERIEKHPRKAQGLYLLESPNDAAIHYLYQNAFLVAFPTFEEGFGLPVIEAIERGSVVIASDIPVLREVGGDYCDYFNPEDSGELISLVKKYLSRPSLYDEKKEHLKDYIPVKWDMVANKIIMALKTQNHKNEVVPPRVKQMVILSARTDMLLSTLPYIEKFMPFITEVVVCCPDKKAALFKEKYRGRLNLLILTDEEALEGAALPEDHQTLNMYLRCMAMKNSKIDDVFIMSDDDYRPLKIINLNVYYKDGKYQAYYCFDLADWVGTAWKPTSFDRGMQKTAAFLKKNHYPCRHFASHMPQIIDKRLFWEMLETHPGIETAGYCEWNTYFNYLQYHYPDSVLAVPYKSMCWPGNPTDWKSQVYPNEYLFENYYEESYQKDSIFEGYSTTLTDNTEVENIEKIQKFADRQMRYLAYQKEFDLFSKMYVCEYRELVSFDFLLHRDWKELTAPKYLILQKNGFVWIPFEIKISAEKAEDEEKLTINSYYSDSGNNTFYHAAPITMPVSNCKFDFPLYGYRMEGNYFYNVEFELGRDKIRKVISVAIID
ncbi:MAG: glycosyltransferase family 4 protein [Lachnospiraceae bacterium]|nr:glycosyltransferase family 4 protein [Lachnospiraceae bacterium]